MNTPSNAGKEHNPWDRKPHEYGAPEWRLLNTDEAVQIGDEYNYKDYRCEPRWAAVEHTGYLPISHTEYRRRTTLPTQSKPCNYCEGAGRVETAPCVSDVCPVCKGERYCAPPTQSKEGETPQVVHGYTLPDGKDATDLDWWKEFAEYFEKKEGSTPQPRDSHAKLLFEYFVEGAFQSAMQWVETKKELDESNDIIRTQHNLIKSAEARGLAKGQEELTAAQRDNARLRKMIEEAPHGEYCEATSYGSWEDRLKHCTCWKARAATEEGKRG